MWLEHPTKAYKPGTDAIPTNEFSCIKSTSNLYDCLTNIISKECKNLHVIKKSHVILRHAHSIENIYEW